MQMEYRDYMSGEALELQLWLESWAREWGRKNAGSYAEIEVKFESELDAEIEWQLSEIGTDIELCYDAFWVEMNAAAARFGEAC